MTIIVDCPFLKTQFMDEITWVPCKDGTQFGKMILTVVAKFKPGKYQERVFYTREFIDPDGKRFGNKKLRCKTIVNFEKLLKGYPL